MGNRCYIKTYNYFSGIWTMEGKWELEDSVSQRARVSAEKWRNLPKSNYVNKMCMKMEYSHRHPLTEMAPGSGPWVLTWGGRFSSLSSPKNLSFNLFAPAYRMLERWVCHNGCACLLDAVLPGRGLLASKPLSSSVLPSRPAQFLPSEKSRNIRRRKLTPRLLFLHQLSNTLKDRLHRRKLRNAYALRFKK